MQKREDTPARLTRRKYEQKNLEERNQFYQVFATKLPRAEVAEINSFLKKHHLSKVELIRMGYMSLLETFNEVPKG